MSNPERDQQSRGTAPYFGGSPTSFKEAHPQITKISLSVTECGKFRKLDQTEMSSTYTIDNMPSSLKCSNPNCHNGGLDLHADTKLQILTIESLY